MKLLGMHSGIGSMLIGAKSQEWNIVGNIESRDYFYTGTFENNFSGSFLVDHLWNLSTEQILKCEDIDLVIGHPACGSFSNLKATGKKKKSKNDGGIEEFIETVQIIKPKIFALENLPKSLTVLDYQFYHNLLPEYDIFFEYISNYNYGNIQKGKKRLFVIGARKELNFYFIPSEFEFKGTTLERCSGLTEASPNHQYADKNAIIKGWSRYHFDKTYIPLGFEKNRITLEQFQEFIKDFPNDTNFLYYNKKGEQNSRLGFRKISVNRHCSVLSGGSNSAFDNKYRSDTLMPLTIRERARIQGFNDDFIFYPTEVKTNKDYQNLIKQTGRCIAVEFCTHLTQYIKDFFEGNINELNYTNQRFLIPNKFIDENKAKYCEEVGYSNQEKACQFCWLKNCKIKKS